MQMEVRVILKAAGFICLVAVGLPANLSILLLFCRLRFLRGHLPPNDLIISNLAAMNVIVLLCRGLPQTLTAFGVKRFMNDWGCKVIIFAYRMGRAMSISVTALLGCYQSVSVAPATPRWTIMKKWLPPHLLHTIIILYVLNFIIPSGSFLFTEAPSGNGSVREYMLNLEFCIVVYPGAEVYVAHGTANTVRDVFFVALMVLAAVYMLVILYRHRQQVKGLRGASKASAGASQAVLLLVCTYVALFGLENVLWGYTLSVSQVLPAVSDARVFFASCYSALSPVLIIASNRRLAGNFLCCKCEKKANEDPSVSGQSSNLHVGE
ncbi:olfactory receptor class A-like protein 1 [Scleropages formosus]|uniref:olfactory receptor class A-like protein 1 n=1 Tax=Scleropages formosus TaxID=113540 RepID=UPI0010FAC472|nr:olfactory receptor class A-like protein 1 [Scleropages formosus]